MTPQPAAASAADLDAIHALLRDGRLPHEDITAALLGNFLVLRADAALRGVIGLERRGDAGLLRSLAVRAADQGRGCGRQLVAALESHARAIGIRELWLLTTTADRFFARLGYRESARSAAPPAVTESAEFRLLCPASAKLMAKSL